MKSEERHQLMANDLEVVTERAVGFFERHLESLIAAVCAVVVLAAFIFWWTQSSTADNSAGWTMLDTAVQSEQNLQQLGSVADRYKGKPPGQWAQLKIAEKAAQNALPVMFTNRELAKSELKSAREGFESLLQDKTVPSTVRERSLWGLALCLETLCDGDTSKPIEAYERLIADFPESIFKTVAEERIASLNRNDAKEFYSWFSKEDPKPIETRPPDGKTSGSNLPLTDFSDVDKSNSKSGEKSQDPSDGKTSEESKDEKSGTGTPADATNPATGDKPATSEKPPETTAPKEGEKPAENK